MLVANLAKSQMPKAQANRGDENQQDEVLPEVSDLSFQFVGLLQEEIVKIFWNKFKLINFYRLRQIQGLTFETYQNKNRVAIEDVMLKLRKTLGAYYDYDSSFYDIWSDVFINYTLILVHYLRQQRVASKSLSLNSTALL